mmetsp:Transcript_35100/g.109267  ORF Transcript_35100/g.109267 Transcript_35100/m.109267 type:complete len:158 (-) Transcript_35100:17-490(-)
MPVMEDSMVLLQVGHAVLSKMQDKAARQDAIAAVVSQLRGFPGGMGTVIVLVMVTIGLTYFFLAFMSEPMEDTCPEVSLEDKLRLQQADHFTKELLKHKEQSEDVPNNAQTGASSSCNASPAASVILEDAGRSTRTERRFVFSSARWFGNRGRQVGK